MGGGGGSVARSGLLTSLRLSVVVYQRVKSFWFVRSFVRWRCAAPVVKIVVQVRRHGLWVEVCVLSHHLSSVDVFRGSFVSRGCVVEKSRGLGYLTLWFLAFSLVAVSMAGSSSSSG